ncbi:low temperature requirement protein A [Nocardioides luteus]|uniref:Low temperature requirement protein A n=1 Tax=Nocardioides luteus TaxID=1844 RepID=A0A1J4N1Z3_9ACTN|nr:low temperature requirement protein A [Nocardioides luteus]OIJ24401.1 hypothetical protein UG56_023240 [Nocardioides luteus]
MATELAHRRRSLVGRSPDEQHRTATPLELLYDLVFIVAFGQAADELAHHVAAGRPVVGLVGFSLGVVLISWAWGSNTWFASAYDEDDWICRLTTMVQMVGVVIVALGLPEMFAALAGGENGGYGIVVGGYVVMRVPMAVQWLRAARNDPVRRPALMTYFWTIASAQAGWTSLAAIAPPLPAATAVGVALLAIETVGPVIAQRGKGGTPWNADHVAERYGLLVIVALGEVVLGTVAAVSATVHGPAGWSIDAAVTATAGIGLALAMWWMYFTVPSALVLRVHRERVFFWSYGHHVIVGAIVAVGAGLHVAALHLEHDSQIGTVPTVLTVAVPLVIFVWMLYAQWKTLVRLSNRRHLGLIIGTAAVTALAVVLVAAGVSIALGLAVIAVAAVLPIAWFELAGHRDLAAALAPQALSG